jgi:hypothetical protein
LTVTIEPAVEFERWLLERVDAARDAHRPPRVLLQASAIGDRADNR